MIYKCFLDESKRIKNFSHHQILSKFAYPHLSRKLQNWLILVFFFIHFKTVKASQNDQVRMQTWFTGVFLMNGTELRSFSHFQILTKIAYPDLSRELENWLILEFFFIHWKLWKSVKMIKFECRLHLQVFSWWTEHN